MAGNNVLIIMVILHLINFGMCIFFFHLYMQNCNFSGPQTSISAEPYAMSDFFKANSDVSGMHCSYI